MSTTIRLSRTTAFRDKVRAYKVLIDGAEVGVIKEGEGQVFEVTPGSHSLRMKIDWCHSPQRQVEIPEGGEASYVCSPNGGAFFALLRVIFTPGAYINLEPAVV